MQKSKIKDQNCSSKLKNSRGAAADAAKRYQNFAFYPATVCDSPVGEERLPVARIPLYLARQSENMSASFANSAGSQTLTSLRSGYVRDILHFDFGRRRAPGFTLLEMIVATGIFSVVVVASIGITLSVKSAQEKASNIQNIQDNVRFAVESMTKELRQGSNYQLPACGSVYGLKQCQKITFTSSRGTSVSYCKPAGTILRLEGAGACETDGLPLVAPSISISQFFLYVAGEAAGSGDGQPRVTLVLSGAATGAKTQLQSSFNLQTTVTQRVRDL